MYKPSFIHFYYEISIFGGTDFWGGRFFGQPFFGQPFFGADLIIFGADLIIFGASVFWGNFNYQRTSRASRAPPAGLLGFCDFYQK